MQGRVSWLTLLIALSGFLLCAVAGCGDSTTLNTPKAKKSKKAKTPEPLPEMDESSVLVDQGRVEFFAPRGWYVSERSEKYLAMTCYRRSIRYPEIALRGEDFPEIERVTDDNVKRFATMRREAMADEEIKLFKEVKPVRIGSFVGIEYQRLAKVRNKIIARLFLETVVDGRLYRVELRATKSSVGNNIGFGHALVAALRFPKAGSSATAEPVDSGESVDDGETADDQQPADENATQGEEKPSTDDDSPEADPSE